MTRLAVLADPHCDDFGSKLDPVSGLNARWTDTIEMVRWVARDARTRTCDALIVAGDLSESRHPAPWRVAQIGEALDEFGGPTILVRGNHDGERGGRSIVDVLAAGRPGWSGFSIQGIAMVGDTAIAAIPYLDRAWKRAQPGWETRPDAELYNALAEDFLTIARGLYIRASEAATGGSVLVIHQALAGAAMSDAQRAFLGDLSLVVDARALADVGFEAVVAGHFHMHQVLSERPLVAYAGSPYRTDFGEEGQQKGYLVVDVDPGQAAMQFVETPARRFVTIDASAWPQDPEHGGPDSSIFQDAVVRVLNLPPEDDAAQVRGTLENLGAFEVMEVRRRPVDRTEAAGGLAESLTAAEALEAYFADDPDREALIERGRQILEAVA